MSNNTFHGDGFFDWQLVTNETTLADCFHYDEKTQWDSFSKDMLKRRQSYPEWAIAPIIKYEGNPVFAPDSTGWDSGRFGGGVHNGAVVKRDGKMYYIYRAEFPTPQDERLSAQIASGIDYHCDIGVSVSDDGIHFERIAGPLFRNGNDFIFSFEDVCIVDAGEKYFIYLNRWDWARREDPSQSGIICCESTDLIHWTNHGLCFPNAKRIHRNPCVLQDENNRPIRDAKGRYVMYINDGLIAFSDDLLHWQSEENENSWPGGEGCFALARKNDIVLFTGGHHSGHFYAIGEVHFSPDDPKKPLGWLENPVITADPGIPWEDGRLAYAPFQSCSPFCDTIFFTGMTLWKGKMYLYYGGSEFYTCLATFSEDLLK